jgi:hypothetical protein
MEWICDEKDKFWHRIYSQKISGRNTAIQVLTDNIMPFNLLASGFLASACWMM